MIGKRLLLGLIAPLLPLHTLTLATTEVNLYQRVEEMITHDKLFSNPFTDTELRLSVTAPPGRPLGSSFTWYGFHDGDGQGGQIGHIWKFRLLFDYPGTWIVNASFYIPGTSTTNGPSHTFTYNVSAVKVPGEHGHIYRDLRNWRRLRHADGTPWVPFSFHGSMLLDREQTVSRQWIDEHISRGIDAIAVRFHSEAWILSGETGKWHYLLKSGTQASSWPGSATAFDYTRFDLATWRYNEQTIEYARSKGVKLSIWFGISGLNTQYWSYGPTDYPTNTSLGPKQKLFIKYFLARWAPYTNWWHWTVDSEYEETGAGALERVRTYSAELRVLNPWRTLVTTHVLSNWTPGSSAEFDLATLQRPVEDTDLGTTNSAIFISDNDHFGLPVYNSEGVWSLSTVTRSRLATWAHLMAGGFSHIAHFEKKELSQFMRMASAPILKLLNLINRPFGINGDHRNSSWGVTWDQVNPRHREDVSEIGKMVTFLNKTPGIDINCCMPHNDLATVTNGHLAFCLADPGQSYYIWLDRGGILSLNLSRVSGTFSVARYRGTALDSPVSLPTVSAGSVVSLGATPTTGFGNDYLFVVKRLTATPPAIPHLQQEQHLLQDR